ncbi:MAG: S1 RNA-binding domain-containing protein [Bacilli bacterium]|nr:S1 RNA-binding domain-containing protein [Bacilli bacterium]
MKKYKIGDVVTGTVTGIESYGVFVNVDEYYTGMVHISEISDKFVSNIADNYLVGDNIRAIVIDIIEEKKQLKLSIKSLNKKECIDKSLNGFEPLKEKLPEWINDKISEIEQ